MTSRFQRGQFYVVLDSGISWPWAVTGSIEALFDIPVGHWGHHLAEGRAQ